jgi:dihydroflavonol-4-reductase
MRCFVTGATGFVGGNLVRALLEQGHEVRALMRPGSQSTALAALDFEPIVGDVLDRKSLGIGLARCDWCFHVAASYHLWLPDYASMYASNVEGTRNVIEAAATAGCSRIVYTSTVGCIGLPPRIQGPNNGGNEYTSLLPSQLSNHYKRSKWQAEQVALELAGKGLPVVIVNPSTPVGPGDVKPTPTGKIIIDFMQRKMPAYLETGLNWVHVRDVAMGHILAAEKGRVGDRYILGNAEANWTLKETFAVLEDLTGIPAPRVRIPYLIALMAAYFDEAKSSMTGKSPRAPLGGVRMARYKMFFNPSKAIRELALPQTPARQALKEAVEWFKNAGMV